MPKRAGRETQVFFAGFDLSSQLTALTVSIAVDTPQQSGFQDLRKSYLVGQQRGQVRHRGLLTAVATEAHEVLRARIGSSDVFTATWGTAQALESVAGSAVALANHEARAAIDEAVAIDSAYDAGPDSPGLDFCKTIAPLAQRSAATASVDNGASTSAGARAYLQQTAVAAGTPTVALQHSTDDSVWADLIAFTAAAGRSAQAGASTGTVNRYLRGNITGGTATFLIAARRL